METFTERRWGDGLPLIPPTPERVEWVLEGTDRTPGTVLGAMGPSMGEVTVRQLAINAAMAGARPEHLPVIIAAMEAITAYPYDYHAPLARGVAPLVIVNGPIVDQLGINHAQNELGPHPGYPAGAVIGRAINLAMRNLGGFGRGYVPPAQHGQPGTYTGLVIGEAEDVVPWTPLNVELGFERGTNTVTVLGVSGTVGVPGPNPEHAAAFVPPSIPFWPSTRFAWQRSTVGVLLVTPLQARRFFGQGRSKQDIKEVLYTYARTPRDEFERTWQLDEFEPTGFIGWLLRTTPEDEPIPIAAGPDSFLVVTAGGWDSSVAFSWLFTDLYMNVPTTKVVHLPQDWEDLLSER
ncbi:hypothetical protein LIP_0367 [Limnochorda pilosa]|uniref:Uncharacterized protein n=2 Tax=Limnochorda pilosa TaxID=1555112 RepID=A0A0K2SHD7_LIMPI|nr:hypothetical protein LIP_0367 [Limnochorda pilosa]